MRGARLDLMGARAVGATRDTADVVNIVTAQRADASVEVVWYWPPRKRYRSNIFSPREGSSKNVGRVDIPIHTEPGVRRLRPSCVWIRGDGACFSPAANAWGLGVRKDGECRASEPRRELLREAASQDKFTRLNISRPSDYLSSAFFGTILFASLSPSSPPPNDWLSSVANERIVFQAKPIAETYAM